MSTRARAYLELLRPANVVTALADILAGYGIAGLPESGALPWLLASTAGLYAGGVVLNDFFDRSIDATERPERPIPSGRVPARYAAWLGVALLAGGVLTAFRAGALAGLIAAAIAALVILYDSLAKGSGVLGPPMMGACRALNLLLGMTAAAGSTRHAWIAVLPFIYIWSVAALSRGEVHGGSRSTSAFALAGVATVLATLLAVGLRRGEGLLLALLPLLFVLLFAVRVLPAFWSAFRVHQAPVIRRAVRTGVLSLVVLDASLAALYAGAWYGLLVLALSVLASGLARLFAVT